MTDETWKPVGEMTHQEWIVELTRQLDDVNTRWNEMMLRVTPMLRPGSTAILGEGDWAAHEDAIEMGRASTRRIYKEGWRR